MPDQGGTRGGRGLRAEERRRRQRGARVRARRRRRARAAGSLRDRRSRNRSAAPALAELDRPQRRRSAAAGRQRRQRRAVAVRGRGRRPVPADRVASGGATPTSVAVSGELVYVLNNGTPNIAGFRIDDGRLVELEGSSRPLSADDADPAQISFSRDGRTLVVTERGTDSISTYAIDERGYAAGPTTIKSSGKTPYGFDFTADGAMIVTEAFGGAVGAAAASSYSLTESGHAGAGERLGRRYPQRGVLGRGHQRRALRLRDELRRRDDLELRDRRGRQPRAARRRRGLDAPRARRASATRRSPATAATCTRSTPTRRRSSAGRSAATASWSRSERSRASPRRSPGSPRADRRARPV